MIRIALVLALAIAVVLPGAPASAQSQSPRAPVERLNAVLLQVMQNADALGFRGRYNTLEPVLTEAFTFETMARLSIGPGNWTALDPQRRQEFVDAFTRMSVSTFAARFDGYSGQRFQIVDQQDVRRGQVLVRTELVNPDNDSVSLDYLVLQQGDQWRILDIFLGGQVSELSRQRSEFSSVYARSGFQGLLLEIEDNIRRQGG